MKKIKTSFKGPGYENGDPQLPPFILCKPLPLGYIFVC